MCFKCFKLSVVLSLSVLASLCVAKLTQLPANSIQAVVGDTVRIECFTENKDYPPSWSHTRVGSKQSNDVYLTMKISGDERIHGRMVNEYHGRFSVLEDRTTGKYSLQVTGVQPGDAGRYTCTARGGLGQQASAELGVIESGVTCESNATEVIGENICNQEPDLVQLSCSFRFTGNNLPMVNWLKTDQPSQVLESREAEFNADSGNYVSKLFVRADADGLSGSSFMCIVSSIDAKDSRFSCATPVISVLKITNFTESRIVIAPVEVQCIPPPNLPETGECRWVKRELNGDETEIVGTSGRLLNLYRPEFQSGGKYVCIIECNIRGQSCPVEALTITYEPAEKIAATTSQSTSNLILIVVLVVVLSAVAFSGIVVAVVICRKKASKTTAYSTENPLMLNKNNDQDIDVSYGDKTPPRTESVPLTDDQDIDVSYGDKTPPRTESVPLTASNSSDSSIDIADSSFVCGDYTERLLRNQGTEARALTRMRKNAAMRQSLESSNDPVDVAEGIRRSPEESAKDE